MKKSMTLKEMEKVVDDLIAKYGIVKAIEKIELKIKHPGYGLFYCFLCDLYGQNDGVDKCKGCPFFQKDLWCGKIRDNFKSDKDYKKKRKTDYAKMLEIAKSKLSK